MNEHETTELLERLVAPVEPTEPPIWELMERGRRARGRRRGVSIVLAAAAVAAVVGGTAVVAQQLADSSNEPVQPQTSPTGDADPERELDPIDLLGSWEPREVLGETIESESEYVPGLFFHGPRLTVATDYCYLGMAPYTLGAQGEFAVEQLNFVSPYCVDRPEGVVPLANDRVVLLADRLQVVAGVLTVYDEEGEVLGVYERDWAEVEPSDVLGRWRLLAPYSGDNLTVEELEESLHQEAARRPALIGFDRDSYQASDGINMTTGRYALGSQGEFRDWDQFSTLIGCADATVRDPGGSTATEVEPMPLVPPTDGTIGDCERVPNAEILDAAVRVQWFDKLRLLVFYDETGMSIGVYGKVR